MFIKLNSQLVVQDVGEDLLEMLSLKKRQVIFKILDELLHEDVPKCAIESFYSSVYNRWKNTSILKFGASNHVVWLGCKSSICYEREKFSGVKLDLYEVSEEVELVTQLIYDELKT